MSVRITDASDTESQTQRATCNLLKQYIMAQPLNQKYVLSTKGVNMKFLIKKTPDNFIQSVNDEISSILNRNFDSYFPEYIYNDDVYKCAMPVEIDEKEKEYLVKAELPGVKKEDLDIDLEKNRLTISAKREEEHKEDSKGFRKSEFKYGEFSRTVYFPDEIDIDKTKAKLEHGILRIEAPKLDAEKTGTKKLTIS